MTITNNQFIAAQCDQAGESVMLCDEPEIDSIAVNLMRLAGLDKHKARECESIIRQMGAQPEADPDAHLKATVEDLEIYKACAKSAQPVQPSMELVSYQYLWTNPANKPDPDAHLLEWKEVSPTWNQTAKQVKNDILAYRYEGKPIYRVRALYTPVRPKDAA